MSHPAVIPAIRKPYSRFIRSHWVPDQVRHDNLMDFIRKQLIIAIDDN